VVVVNVGNGYQKVAGKVGWPVRWVAGKLVADVSAGVPAALSSPRLALT
jgi:hypothetical protein